MRKYMLALIATGLSLLQVASAATVFDFTGLSAQDGASSINVLSDDGLITATLTATSTGGTVGAAPGLTGLGVRTNGGSAFIQNNEILRIDFSTAVNIDTFLMAGWNGSDELSVLTSAGGSPLILEGAATQILPVNLTDIDYLTMEGNGLAMATTLASLTGVTVVPVPAAVWLFGSGLALLGWARRR